MVNSGLGPGNRASSTLSPAVKIDRKQHTPHVTSVAGFMRAEDRAHDWSAGSEKKQHILRPCCGNQVLRKCPKASVGVGGVAGVGGHLRPSRLC